MNISMKVTPEKVYLEISIEQSDNKDDSMIVMF
jgi:hypothetical protein